MSGKRYWSSGIRVGYTPEPRPFWSAELDFLDEPETEEAPRIYEDGSLTFSCLASARDHQSTVRLVTDALIERARDLDIGFSQPMMVRPTDRAGRGWPEGWRELLKKEEIRLGWRPEGQDEEDVR